MRISLMKGISDKAPQVRSVCESMCSVMADRVKKRPPMFTLKHWNSQRMGDEVNGAGRSPAPLETPHLFRSNMASVASKPANTITESKPRKLSAGGVRELVQCALCLEVLRSPKMLPCQHTFCAACLATYVGEHVIIDCPMCRTRIQVHGPNFVNDLPSNLYIDTLLQLVGVGKSPASLPTTPVFENPPQSVQLHAGGARCAPCGALSDAADVTRCGHCRLKFCRVCWAQHLDDMRIQIKSIMKQLDTAASHLEHKIEHYKDRSERIAGQINIAADEKISAIIEAKEIMLRDAANLQKTAGMSALALQASLEDAKGAAAEAMRAPGPSADDTQVATFMNLHQNAVQLLSEVSKWDTDRFVFDKENFCIEMDSATPLDAESDAPAPGAQKQHDPLESESSLITYYRCHNFVPHHVWRKTARPAGLAVAPWGDHLYVCATDSRSVLVLERAQAKVFARLSCDEMLCPVHVAFLESLGEVYITDKWRHCVHVFSREGAYLRSLGQKGGRAGAFRSPEGLAADDARQHLYVVDTGNDRVQIIQPDGTFVDQIGVASRPQTARAASLWDPAEVLCTELNSPTGAALAGDRLVVLDSGNRRVKVYNKFDKSKILEFGSMGQRKGQFRQPEVLAVDPMGYILVGDSGNCRVQVFKPSGQLVRVFGGLGTEPGKFGWISGIHVTRQMDIIISDTKNHSVNFF